MTLERLYKWKCSNSFATFNLYSHDMDNAVLSLIKWVEKEQGKMIFQLDSIHPVYIPDEWLSEELYSGYTFYYLKS